MSKAVLFSKRGCTPCMNVKKFILSETDLEYTEYNVEKDVDEVAKYDIMSVPTLIIDDKKAAGFAKIVELINETN